MYMTAGTIFLYKTHALLFQQLLKLPFLWGLLVWCSRDERRFRSDTSWLGRSINTSCSFYCFLDRIGYVNLLEIFSLIHYICYVTLLTTAVIARRMGRTFSLFETLILSLMSRTKLKIHHDLDRDFKVGQYDSVGDLDRDFKVGRYDSFGVVDMALLALSIWLCWRCFVWRQLKNKSQRQR